MKTFTNMMFMKKLVWLAVACVLVINAVILGKVFFNHSSVIAQLQLSERELQLPYSNVFDKEDSSKRLRLNWSTLNTEPVSFELNQWGWQYDHQLKLSEAHFASFQFPSCEKTNRRHNKQAAWVLLEFNGQSYRDYVAQAERYYALVQGMGPTTDTEISNKELENKRSEATKSLEAAKNIDSRLFVIDAAADRELLEAALQARNKSDHTTLVIVPAEVQAGHKRCDKTEEKTTGILVSNLTVESLYVPKDFAQNLPRNTNEKSSSPFAAEVYYGRLYEPWINNLSRCKQDCS